MRVWLISAIITEYRGVDFLIYLHTDVVGDAKNCYL